MEIFLLQKAQRTLEGLNFTNLVRVRPGGDKSGKWRFFKNNSSAVNWPVFSAEMKLLSLAQSVCEISHANLFALIKEPRSHCNPFNYTRQRRLLAVTHNSQGDKNVRRGGERQPRDAAAVALHVINSKRSSR